MVGAGATGPNEECTVANEPWGPRTGLIDPGRLGGDVLDYRICASSMNVSTFAHDKTTLIVRKNSSYVVTPTDRDTLTLLRREA